MPRRHGTWRGESGKQFDVHPDILTTFYRANPPYGSDFAERVRIALWGHSQTSGHTVGPDANFPDFAGYEIFSVV